MVLKHEHIHGKIGKISIPYTPRTVYIHANVYVEQKFSYEMTNEIRNKKKRTVFIEVNKQQFEGIVISVLIMAMFRTKEAIP